MNPRRRRRWGLPGGSERSKGVQIRQGTNRRNGSFVLLFPSFELAVLLTPLKLGSLEELPARILLPGSPAGRILLDRYIFSVFSFRYDAISVLPSLDRYLFAIL